MAANVQVENDDDDNFSEASTTASLVQLAGQTRIKAAKSKQFFALPGITGNKVKQLQEMGISAIEGGVMVGSRPNFKPKGTFIVEALGSAFKDNGVTFDDLRNLVVSGDADVAKVLDKIRQVDGKRFTLEGRALTGRTIRQMLAGGKAAYKNMSEEQKKLAVKISSHPLFKYMISQSRATNAMKRLKEFIANQSQEENYFRKLSPQETEANAVRAAISAKKAGTWRPKAENEDMFKTRLKEGLNKLAAKAVAKQNYTKNRFLNSIIGV